MHHSLLLVLLPLLLHLVLLLLHHHLHQHLLLLLHSPSLPLLLLLAVVLHLWRRLVVVPVVVAAGVMAAGVAVVQHGVVGVGWVVCAAFWIPPAALDYPCRNLYTMWGSGGRVGGACGVCVWWGCTVCMPCAIALHVVVHTGGCSILFVLQTPARRHTFVSLTAGSALTVDHPVDHATTPLHTSTLPPCCGCMCRWRAP